MMRYVWLLVGCAACVVGDGGLPELAHEGPLPELEQAIVGGTLSLNDTSVVALEIRKPEGLFTCSGTVISPHVVLTAAHCLEDATQVEVIPHYDADSVAAQRLPARTFKAHPDFYVDEQVIFHHDVGLIALRQPTSLPPLPYLRAPGPEVVAGTKLRVVGYGRTDLAKPDAGTRRTAEVRVAQFHDGVIEFSNATTGICKGDSGGPGIVDINGRPTVVGVNSFVDDQLKDGKTVVPLCRHKGYQSTTLVDTAFIDAFVDAHDPGWRLAAQHGQTAKLAGETTLAAPRKYVVRGARPGSRFVVAMSGEGRMDLYVRLDAQPTNRRFDCRPNLQGPNETCEVSLPSGGGPRDVYMTVGGSGRYVLDAAWE